MRSRFSQRITGSLGVPLDDLVTGLEWRPGYTIVVPGGWEVAERNDQTSRIHDDPAPDTPRGAGRPAHNGSLNPDEATAMPSQPGTSRSSR